MKVTVDIECTPEEARRFMGLPDLSALHEVYLGKMQAMMGEGISPDLLTEMMKTWGPMSESGLALWGQMFGQSAGRK